VIAGFILAVFLGLIPAAIAHKKGENFFLWWLFGAALFIVALPYAMKRDKALRDRTVANRGMTQCTCCSREISAKASACPGCGAPVVPLGQVDQVQTNVQDQVDGLRPSNEAVQVAQPIVPREASTSSVVGIVGVVLGAASVFMPYFAAVFLVPVAFVCGLVALLRGRRGLGITGMVLAGIGLIGILFVSQQISKIIKDPFAPNALIGTNSAPVVTMAEYEQIHEGMSYEETVAIIGSPGEELSRSDMAGYSTVMYSWQNDSGSNMNAMFQNGKLVNKAQLGLR
jgi:hypothetical protein